MDSTSTTIVTATATATAANTTSSSKMEEVSTASNLPGDDENDVNASGPPKTSTDAATTSDIPDEDEKEVSAPLSLNEGAATDTAAAAASVSSSEARHQSSSEMGESSVLSPPPAASALTPDLPDVNGSEYQDKAEGDTPRRASLLAKGSPLAASSPNQRRFSLPQPTLHTSISQESATPTRLQAQRKQNRRSLRDSITSSISVSAFSSSLRKLNTKDDEDDDIPDPLSSSTRSGVSSSRRRRQRLPSLITKSSSSLQRSSTAPVPATYRSATATNNEESISNIDQDAKTDDGNVSSTGASDDISYDPISSSSSTRQLQKRISRISKRLSVPSSALATPSTSTLQRSKTTPVPATHEPSSEEQSRSRQRRSGNQQTPTKRASSSRAITTSLNQQSGLWDSSSISSSIHSSFGRASGNHPQLAPEVVMVQSSLHGSAQRRINEAMAAFTMHKLDFERTGLIGRKEESTTLKNCLDTVCAVTPPIGQTKGEGDSDGQFEAKNNNKQLVFVDGISGTGKTALATSSLTPIIKKKGGSLVRGKYERHHSNEPLSGIGMACQELCRLILENPQRLPRIRLALEDQLDKQLLSLLESVIPGAFLSIILSASSVGGLSHVAEGSALGNSSNSNNQIVKPSKQQNLPRPKKIMAIQRMFRNAAGRLVPGTMDPNDGASIGRISNASSLSKSAPFTFYQGEYRDASDRSFTASSGDAGRSKMMKSPAESKQVLRFAIQTFLRILCTPTALGPVAMVLDDLQWADPLSLDVLEAIAKDPSITNLMLIGCYRSEEVQEEEDHPLATAINTLKEGEEGQPYAMTQISLDVLPFEDVNEWIMELLSLSDSRKAAELSSICFKRTLGSPLYVKVFLQMLQDAGFLEFNIGLMEWTWDCLKIENDTVVTDNVVTLMETKMRQYSQGMVLLLQIAACLGSTFDHRTLGVVWSHLQSESDLQLESDDDTKRDDRTSSTWQYTVDELLKVATREMLIEQVISVHGGERLYRFIHDKVSEAVVSLLPEEEDFDELRNKVGICLLQSLSEDEVEERLFVLLDNLNNGRNCSVEIADLNAQAAEKAKDLAAFSSASRYVEFGIMSLNGVDMWAKYPYLALRLHSIGAEVEEWAGNREKSNQYCKEVRKRKELSPIHMMRVNKIVIERLYSDGQYDELWQTCFELLSMLGCNLPRNKKLQKFKGAWYLQDTKKFLPTEDDIYGMPVMADPKKLEALALMVRAASFALATKNKPLYVLLCCKCVRWTKKYGLTAHTASALASFANVLMHQESDWATAMQVAPVALAIEKRLGSNYTKTSTLHKSNSFVLGWVKPLRTCRSDYLEAYKLGMLSGNIEAVGMTVLFLLASEFFSSGSNLQCLDKDLQNYIPQLELLGLHSYVLGLRMLRQKVLNLMGAPYNPGTTALTGTAMHGMDAEKHPFIFNTVGRHHICNLCAYFGEYEEGAEIALSMGDSFYKTFLGASYFGFETFSRALCLYAMAIETGGNSNSSTSTSNSSSSSSSRYLKAAREARQSIATWVSNGAINLVHQLLFLDAEDAVAKGSSFSHKQTKKLFGKAITTAVKGGFLQDAGMVNERFAVYLNSKEGSSKKSDASFHMKEAKRYYTEWGAFRKAALLEEKYSDLLKTDSPCG